jgi:hypothetical protein
VASQLLWKARRSETWSLQILELYSCSTVFAAEGTPGRIGFARMRPGVLGRKARRAISIAHISAIP